MDDDDLSLAERQRDLILDAIRRALEELERPKEEDEDE
jgi:hypothetical protein